MQAWRERGGQFLEGVQGADWKMLFRLLFFNYFLSSFCFIKFFNRCFFNWCFQEDKMGRYFSGICLSTQKDTETSRPEPLPVCSYIYWNRVLEQILNKYMYNRYLFKILNTHLLQNVIQDNSEIIYSDWCMLTVTKSFIGYIFFYLASMFQFSFKIFNSTPWFFHNSEKYMFSFWKWF